MAMASHCVREDPQRRARLWMTGITTTTLRMCTPVIPAIFLTRHSMHLMKNIASWYRDNKIREKLLDAGLWQSGLRAYMEPFGLDAEELAETDAALFLTSLEEGVLATQTGLIVDENTKSGRVALGPLPPWNRTERRVLEALCNAVRFRVDRKVVFGRNFRGEKYSSGVGEGLWSPHVKDSALETLAWYFSRPDVDDVECFHRVGRGAHEVTIMTPTVAGQGDRDACEVTIMTPAAVNIQADPKRTGTEDNLAGIGFLRRLTQSARLFEKHMLKVSEALACALSEVK